MGKYLLKRLLRGLLSVVGTIILVMIIVYSLIDKNQIVNASDVTYSKLKNNEKIAYKYQKWEDYGYINYVNFKEYVTEQYVAGNITQETKDKITLGSKEGDPENYYIATNDNDETAAMVKEFTEYYTSKGYSIERMKQKNKAGKNVADTGGKSQLVAMKNIPLVSRIFKFFTSIIHVDNIHYAPTEVTELRQEVDPVTGMPAWEDEEKTIPKMTEAVVQAGMKEDVKRGIEFTLYDPSKGGKTFSPAILGTGTEYKYLLYFDNKFPFVHQNLIKIRLGVSTSLKEGVDTWEYINRKQGAIVIQDVYYPAVDEDGSQHVEQTADNLHTLRYSAGTYTEINPITYRRYVDDYTVTDSLLDGKSKLQYSFIVGIISTIISYLIGLPLGILMARKKGKVIDKVLTAYIIFMTAVPSLAYIYMVKAIGNLAKLPVIFFVTDAIADKPWLIYVVPIISLAVAPIAGFMKWIRRYMVDQANSDYVKFARSEGLSEKEIFNKHISKNALIPVVQGIPGSILGALFGASITEGVYNVPGIGKTLIEAISAMDNPVIVGLTLFFGLISVLSMILGDVLMAMVDPRISFTKGGR